ncbi:uncharacterized protein BJ212DRAFT_1299326 [Suillus subaureus]|uniref:Uncharacterized protein n=1 Tax=Suillus subaureus TaxID=48587 RepID=A0A9P7JDR4_9AGAM|nr:uncharacterized protein BJ212DRAFT_1299326 [Suillus subaureus]KAG1817162.1 hypothetical protein BJ212DRAFT_1299326 [Suillus subaureus]
MPCFVAPAPQSPPVSLCMVQTLSESSLVPAPPAMGVFAPPAVTQENLVCAPTAYKADFIQEDDLGHLNLISIYLMPIFAPYADVQYVDVYEDEPLYPKLAYTMADECLLYHHRGVMYNPWLMESTMLYMLRSNHSRMGRGQSGGQLKEGK